MEKVTKITSSELPRAIHEILAVGKSGVPISTESGANCALVTLYSLPDWVPANKVVVPGGENLEYLILENGKNMSMGAICKIIET